jgi:hypothetical protein
LKVKKPVEVPIQTYKSTFMSKYLNSISGPSPFKEKLWTANIFRLFAGHGNSGTRHGKRQQI